jgi:hypothetical protein
MFLNLLFSEGMKTTDPVDAARIELLLTELRLPTAKAMWAKFAAQSDKEGWPATRFLAVLAEHELAGWRVLFTRTSDLVQRLQVARRELALESALAKLDKYHLLILDDIAYISKDQAETSVLFELIGSRYERRSIDQTI